ncbi:MAG: TVP38/TMEM64 family protein [Gemmatimonadota bacterium]|nr:MAG: TVP38/TMEM64 family protein [Gemmatimonadota bacterium]
MSELFQSIEIWLDGSGTWSYPIAVGLMAAVAVLPIPAEIPAAMNGMLFGPLEGSVITWLGALVGAQLSFELGRRFGRPLIERIVPRGALVGIDEIMHAASWPGLLTARLIPAVAFTAMNWGLGLTLCSRVRFFWTTAIGILPGTIFFVYTGDGLARLYGRHPILAVALVALILVVILLAASRRRRAGRLDSAGAGKVPPERPRP